MKRYRKEIILFITKVFLCVIYADCYADKITEIGNIPLLIEAKGIFISKCEQRYVADPIDKKRKSKLICIVFGGNRIGLSIDQNDLVKKNIYCKVFDRFNNEIKARYINLEKLASANNSTSPLLHLLDTAITINDCLFFDIYDSKTGALIKSYYLKRVAILPTLASPQSHGFLSLYPGKTNELFFTRSKDVKDSTLQYRLINNSDTGKWALSGHRLSLNYLAGNSTYQLEIRYDFQPESIIIYNVLTSSYWYQTNLFYGAISLIFVITTLAATNFVHHKKAKVLQQKQELATQQLKTVQAQLNPHFIFNALSSIQGLMNTGRIDEANLYLSDFSKLMRNTLTESDKVHTKLKNEIAVLDTYLKLEQLRFGFSYTITVSDELNRLEIDMPVLLLQPLIENAVKHGVAHLKETGCIDISFCKSGSKMITTIQDNGKGHDFETNDTGYGLKLTNDRIKIFNQMLNYNAIELSSIYLNGVKVILTFNDWL